MKQGLLLLVCIIVLQSCIGAEDSFNGFEPEERDFSLCSTSSSSGSTNTVQGTSLDSLARTLVAHQSRIWSIFEDHEKTKIELARLKSILSRYLGGSKKKRRDNKHLRSQSAPPEL